MIDVLKAYVQVATGVGELTRQRALEAARQALAASPAAGVLPAASAGVDGLTAQASALADELLEAGRHNREQLRQLVSSEVESVVARLGIGQGVADAQAQLAAARARVRELEQALAAATSGRVVTRRAQTETLATALAPDTTVTAPQAADPVAGVDATTAATSAPTRPAVDEAAATKAAATKAAARKAAAKKAAAKRATAKKAAADTATPASVTGPPAPGGAAPTAVAARTASPSTSAPATKSAPRKAAATSSAPGPQVGAPTAEKPTPATAMPQVAPSDAAQQRAAELADDGSGS